MDHEKNKRPPQHLQEEKKGGKTQSLGANDSQISLNLKATPLHVINRTVTSRSYLSICEGRSLLAGLISLLIQRPRLGPRCTAFRMIESGFLPVSRLPCSV